MAGREVENGEKDKDIAEVLGFLCLRAENVEMWQGFKGMVTRV